ncbi:hypothetical protein VOLCADRAFT_61462 [Volvox carteri f. nagariensis]|uniref:Histone deacetylase n=1 Tax=Volvox carteri f. nagariensis TaxID=3068 RepID=D8TYU9_VOLCA|nr:uncharacterized protein VOLCADRAFT_61462 [Volvox carteri f. nagariensis]EFJ47455.1 hypothetical protein VOLCADRAFT_61462 [Volvox carteri f. nagariensis]|eukprot:XP_002951644.1 hypothetical protein VOLCADRAFT_61462 [Volvox carteri f. nagariensis]
MKAAGGVSAAAAAQSALAPAGPDAGTAPPIPATAAGTAAAARTAPVQPSQTQQQQSYPTPRTRIYYNPELSMFSLGEDHPMVPHRLHLTHRLAELWGLFDDPAVQVVRDYPPATTDQLRRFHTDEYIAFLEYLDTLDLETMSDEDDDDDEGGDCPIFPGLLRYVGLQAAGSILAARDLAHGLCDVAVHWGGGMHHGMPYRAFGFCYVNDLVLAILELMAVCGRVLYIGEVEGIFRATNDTLNHGKPQRPVFFPGTGKKNDLGEGTGKYYTVNVPLQDDITDDSYFHVYKAVVKTAFERFKPQAVVLQCGCDSVAGDKLGRFNLSIRGHSRQVEWGFGAWRVPLLVTGGGGYTPPLVARCWTLETAVLLGMQLGEAMPPAVAKAEDLADLGPSYFK